MLLANPQKFTRKCFGLVSGLLRLGRISLGTTGCIDDQLARFAVELF
jgi:hypothetical protein